MSFEVTGLLRYPESILQTLVISFCSSGNPPHVSSAKLIRDSFIKLGTVVCVPKIDEYNVCWHQFCITFPLHYDLIQRHDFSW